MTTEDASLFLRDAISFVASSRKAIKSSVAHVYLSALPFTPKTSLVRQTFGKSLTGLPSVETFGIDYRAERCAMVISERQEGIQSISYSPDGNILASGSLRGTVWLWDARSGAEIRQLETGRSESIDSIAFTPDGHHLIARTNVSGIFLWDVRTGHRVLELRRIKSTSNVSVVVVSPDGDKFARFEDGTISAFTIHDRQPVCKIPSGHEGSVWALAFSPDGKTLASCGTGDIVRLWNCHLGEPVGEPLTGHKNLGSSLAFSPDGGFLASGSRDGVVCVWNAQTRQQHRTYSGHQKSVNSMAFAPDGRTLASGSDDRTVRVWNLQDNDCALAAPLVLRGHHASVNAVYFSTDGFYVASCSTDGTIRVWDVSGSYPSVPHQQRGFSSDDSGSSGSLWSGWRRPLWPLGSLALALRSPGALRAKSVVADAPLDGHIGWVTAVAVSGDSRLIASASRDGSVRVWDARTCKPMYPPLLGDAGPVLSVAFSPNSQLIASGSSDTIVRLWNARKGHRTPSELRGHNERVNTVAFSPNSLRLASGSNDHTVRIWDVSITRPTQILQITCDRHVRSAVYSPNGKLIAVGEALGEARIFDAATGAVVRSLEDFNGQIKYGVGPLAFSPDSARIMLSTSTTRVVALDIRTRAGKYLAECHTGRPTALVYSPDGQFIASAERDATVYIWDTKTAKVIKPVLRGHVGAVRSVVFSPDGRFLVTGGSDSTIHVWDLKRLAAIQRDKPALASLAFAEYHKAWLVSPTPTPYITTTSLLWVPREYRGCLEIGGVSRVIATRRAVVTVDDGVLHQGEHWTQCWRTDNSSSF